MAVKFAEMVFFFLLYSPAVRQAGRIITRDVEFTKQSHDDEAIVDTVIINLLPAAIDSGGAGEVDACACD